MSNFEEANIRADLPLSEREVQQLRRLLSDPFSWPPEFMKAIRTRLSNDPPDLTWDSILGFDQAALRAAPAIPSVVLAVDASAALTDLPKPLAPNSIYMLNPGGGSIRSIAEPPWEGSRVTLKHDFFGTTTLKHNDVSGPLLARPLLLSGGADIVLGTSESIDLVYVDTFWQDVAKSGTSLPDRLGIICDTVTDWNSANAQENGWHMAAGAANAPTPAVWYYGITVNHGSAGWCRQIVWQFTGTGGGPEWTRDLYNGVWQPWRQRVLNAAQGVWVPGAMANATLYSQAVVFPFPFPVAPIVQVTLQSFSINEDVRVSAQNVTTTGCDLYAFNGPNGNVCSIGWLATVV